MDDLGTDVNSGFDRAITATDAVATRLDETVAAIDTLRADAAELAASSTPDLARLSNLQGRLGQISDRYLEARVRYAEARENVVGVVSSLQRIARIIPGVRVPEGVGDTLAAVDARSRHQRRVRSTRTVSGADPGAAGWPPSLSRATREGRDRERCNGRPRPSADLAGLQAKAVSTVDSIRSILLLAAIALSVLFVWVLALNIALWVLGRAWERDAARA